MGQEGMQALRKAGLSDEDKKTQRPSWTQKDSLSLGKTPSKRTINLIKDSKMVKVFRTM